MTKNTNLHSAKQQNDLQTFVRTGSITITT